ncbi:Chain family protein [Salix suchowensis]|nr:Chain family protein [Salix suchowensis]
MQVLLTLSNTAMADINNQKHFVLVHGACHGAWCWQKLKKLLESASNRVTLLDLAASGTNMKKIEDVEIFDEYSEPLLDFLASLQPKEKVILVGHSLGGINLALAAEKFPNRIAVAVFLTAFMPDTTHKPSFVMDQYNERTPVEAWLDTQFLPYSSSQRHLTAMLFGPKFLSLKLYQLSPPEDLEQARTLIRPGSLFLYDLSMADNFSAKGYGSVKRVYVICDEDLAIPLEFQRWMIENSGADEVMEIKGADHMVMFSKPRELSQCLSEIAKKHA